MPKTHIHTLICAEQNIHLAGHLAESRTLAPNCPIPWSVRLDTLKGGKQQGVDLITIDNGLIRLRVCPTRGMSIIDATMGELRLGWDSPVKEIVHPAFINQLHRGRTGWLEGFNEFLVRCGLEFMGPPCMDTHHPAIGEPPPTNTTLHGKIANTPASEVQLIVQTTAPYSITLNAVIHERQMYGPKLQLNTQLTITPGQPGFEITDTIQNNGGQPQDICLLYHINQGSPILEQGARLVAPIEHAEPRDDGYPEKDIKHFDRYAGPTPASPEQVYFIDLETDRYGRTGVLLHNKRKTLGLGVSWNQNKLPHFALWKALHDQRDGYVTGLEPCTAYPMPRPDEREAGRLIRLKPDDTYQTELGFELFDDKQTIAKAIAKLI